jgi:hypothetical protein
MLAACSSAETEVRAMVAVILYAGSLESALAAQGEPTREHDYESVQDAVRALVRAGMADTAYAEPIEAGAWLVYDTEEQARADDGQRARGRIEERPISRAQIRALRDEAEQAGDAPQVELCDDAMQGDFSATHRCVSLIANATAHSGAAESTTEPSRAPRSSLVTST